MKSFLMAISFLTIIPVKIKSFNEDTFKNSIKFFPVIGLLIGIILFLISKISFDFEIRGLIITILWIILSGGFHLDGVADLFDAIGSIKDREKCFEIMKDSRIGAIGVIAIVFTLLTKFILVKHTLLLHPILLILPPVAGRYSINFLSWKLDYAKNEGLGKYIVDFTDNYTFIVSSIFTALTFAIINLKFLFLFVDLLFFLYFLSIFFNKKFGGITGDMLGCSVEISEVFILAGGLFFVS